MAIIADDPFMFAGGGIPAPNPPQSVAEPGGGGEEGGGNPEGVLFDSDWATATGTTVNALGDGGLWTDVNPDGMLEVVATTGLGFPAGMANCLKVRLVTGGNSGEVTAVGVWNVPAIGEKLFYRIYFRNDVANEQGDQLVSFHPWELNSGLAAFAYEWSTNALANGTCQCRFRFEDTGDGVEPHWQRVVPENPEEMINKFEVYRLELMLERTDTNLWIAEPRVYNDANELLYDKNNMYNDNGSETLTAFLARGGRFIIDPQYMDEMLVGSSGGAWSFTEDQFIYWGGFMIRSDDWCGAY